VAILLQSREACLLQNTHVASWGLWFTLDDFPSPADLLDAANAAHNAFDDAGFLSCFANELSFVRNTVQVFDFDPPDKVAAQTIAYDSTDAALPGTVAGTSLPADTSCVVFLYSDTPGPRGRGRLYFPPFDVGSVNANGLFSSGYSAENYDAVTRWIGEVQGVLPTAIPVVVSRKHQDAYTINVRVAGTEPDTQRRRGSRAP